MLPLHISTYINNQLFLIKVVSSNKVNNYGLNIDTNNNVVTLKINSRYQTIPQSALNFIKTNEHWIWKRFHRNEKNKIFDLIAKKIMYLGKTYNLKFIDHATIPKNIKKNKWEIINDTIYIIKKQTTNELTTIKDFYLDTCKKEFMPLVEEYEKKMHTPIITYSFKWAKTFLGKCFYNEKHINFVPQIIGFSIDHICYLIIHELAHLHYPNHSNQFWEHVEKYCKNWKKLDKEIKSFSLVY